MIAHMLLTLALLGDDPKANLDGTYMTVAGQENGKAFAEEHFKDTSVVISRGTITVYCARTGEMRVFSYRLTPDNQNRGIDMKVIFDPDDEDVGKLSHGMYEVDGERMRITYYPAGNSQRPTTFETKEGTGQMAFELKRVAP